MQTTLCSEDLAIALAEIRTTPVVSSKTATKIINNFLPAIQQIASSFPKFWIDDFIQEGKIALLNAARKFPAEGNVKDFIKYAAKAIRNHLTNFYHAVVTRQPEIQDSPVYLVDENEYEESYLKYSDEPNAEKNRALAIDLRQQLSETGMLKNGFTQKEVKAFQDYYIYGYSVNEIAIRLNISVSQASKIKNRARNKARTILS
jgi:RNA polymerase sigma factor (sigma-70 family)